MKQETVIKLSMKGEKSRAKAMKIAVAAQGVTSVAIKGGDKELLVVIGNGVDAANLTKSLRDKVGQATIVSVQQLQGTRSYDQEEQDYNYGMAYNPSYANYPTTMTRWSSDNYGYNRYPQSIPANTNTYQVVYDQDPPVCSIM